MTEETQEFRPIAPNPFYTGAPVRDPERFFGREDDFAYVRQRLITETEGIVLLFVGERRSGKTSILFQILNGKLGEGFLPIFVDMQQLAGVNGDRAFFARLAELLLEQAPDPRLVLEYYDFAQGSPSLVFDRLLGDVLDVFPKRLVFLVDEAENLREKVERGELSAAVLMYMASILESRRVSFCLTGSRGLRESEAEGWKHLLGKAASREISFLSRDDTLRLIRKPVEGRVFYAEGVVENIYELTSGHPFYTQVVCTNVVDYLNGARRNRLVVEDLDEVLRTIIDNPPPQLVYAWEERNQQERVALSLLSEESAGIRDPATPAELLEAVERNNYPLDLKAEALHIALEDLYERKVLERTPEGAFYFRVDLFRQWIRRARSIWRLVEEVQPKEKPRRWWIAVAAAALVATVGAGVWLQRSPREAQISAAPQVGLAGATVGKVLVLGNPQDAEVLVDGQSKAQRLPATIDSLLPGIYAVEVRHPKYHPQSQQVVVQAGDITQPPSVELKRLTGWLTVTAQLPGAQIEVRGEQNASGPAPLSNRELPTGTYEVVVRATGYKEQSRSVELAAGRADTLSFGLKADVGHAFLASVPAGAQIWLDGRNQDRKTPARLEALSVGQYKVGFRLDDHYPLDTVLTIHFDRTDTLEVRLRLEPALLSLQSDPMGAEIYLDQSPTPWAKTPTSQRELPAGNYVLRLVYPGHKEQRHPISLKPGENFSRSLPLEPYRGTLRIIGSGGSVCIINTRTNAVFELEVNDDIELPVGIYRIKAKTGKDTTVEVSPDQRKIVKLK